MAYPHKDILQKLCTSNINTRWMHAIVGWAWPSARAEHGAVKCLQLIRTSGHRISQKEYTHTHGLCVRPN